MRIVIPGGSGQVGTVLARAFHGDGHDVVVLSRRPQPRPWRVVEWDGSTLGNWSREIDGADVVINLAGRSVNCRYSAANRAAMIESRVQSTRVVGEAIAQATRPPRLWLQASTATIYVHRFDGANDEASGILGGNEPDAPNTWRFSIDLARAWERTFDKAPTPHTRRVALRSAMTMSPDAGGVFDTLMKLVKRGLGGRAGDGRQYVSWIHAEDFVRAIRWLIDHDEVSGSVNVASPNPVSNAEFMRILRQVSGAVMGLPTARWMLEIGAVFMRTETELILKSRRVVPARLLEFGFTFKFPMWQDAARDLFQEWQASAVSSRMVERHGEGREGRVGREARGSTQSADVLTFGGTIGRLALAPFPGVLLLVGSVLRRIAPGDLIADIIILVAYVTIYCYAAIVVFVIPIMAVWSVARRPGYVVAAIWGTLSAWCSAAMITGVRELVRWAPMFGFGVAGCACGLFYAHLAHPERRRRSGGLVNSIVRH